MAFHPAVGQELILDDVAYTVAEHPAAPGMPYGQEGRAATVYQLRGNGQKRALKVFKPRFRAPGMVLLAEQCASFARLSGLSVCSRVVLTPQVYPLLLRQNPDLVYAVLMPWVEGPTWLELLVAKQAITADASLHLARALAGVLTAMEQNRLAHCDLSGANLLLPALAARPSPRGEDPRCAAAIELVDVEQFYGPGLERPEAVPAGSSGYAHGSTSQGVWASTGDRFAGAVLIAELLGWCDARVRQAAWGESYFGPQEMQQRAQRFQTLRAVLAECWGQPIAGLYEHAWQSATLAECPTFGEWFLALPDAVPGKELRTPMVAGVGWSRASSGLHPSFDPPFVVPPAQTARLETAQRVNGATTPVSIPVAPWPAPADGTAVQVPTPTVSFPVAPRGISPGSCPQCRSVVPAGTSHCPACHAWMGIVRSAPAVELPAVLQLTCPQCRQDISTTNRHCPYCGAWVSLI